MARARWGIMGTGGIAETMAQVLAAVDSPVIAVGSARPGAAERFAQRSSIPRAVHSHRQVAEIEDVDVVYVATTNDRHLQNVLDCVELGKPALCEKPITINARQARQMLGAAREANVFVMEALWMRFQPFLPKVDELIAQGAIGEVRHVQAGFSIPPPQDESRRWLNRDLGGGSLLDLGIYPLSLVHYLLGPPATFQANAHIGPTGVDLDARVISQHAGGATASVAAGFTADIPIEAVVSGTEARIRIHSPFHHSPLVTLEHRGEVIASYDVSHNGHGFEYEIAEVERCLAANLTQSPLRTHADTLAVLEWLDAIRQQCGVEYPQDSA